MIDLKIAYLILAHIDPEHIARLTNKLTRLKDNDVYIHIDKKIDIAPFESLLKKNKQAFFINERVALYWGGYSAVTATLHLLRDAFKESVYDRYVLLQGLDYPLMSNQEIIDFFKRNSDIEFVRACKITGAEEKYFSNRCEQFWFFDHRNFFKRCMNKFSSINPIKIRKGYIEENGKIFDICWGVAQFALTHNCVKYVLEFSNSHEKFNQYFKYVFPADETYFHTIIFNSSFATKTCKNGLEARKKGISNWKNLHYFEYPTVAKIFTHKDFKMLQDLDFMFFRKATTNQSTELLNMIDELHEIKKEKINEGVTNSYHMRNN